MARTIFEAQHCQQLHDRIARLKPDSARRFGKLTAPTMICHLKDSLDVATGVVPARSKNSFMANPLVRNLIIYVVPWPKGKAQTVPEMLATKPAAWDADVATLQAQLKRAAERGASASWAPHPAFGALSGKDYGCLIYRHFDHHLGQFGV